MYMMYIAIYFYQQKVSVGIISELEKCRIISLEKQKFALSCIYGPDPITY